MKRLTNTLFVIFLMTNILFGQVQLPTFQYLTVAPKTVKNNENIEITISVFDSIYGIRNLAVSIFNPENENIFQVLVRSTDYVGNNTYKANYRISEWAVSGVYKVGDLVVINNNDNILRNLTTLDSFTVVSSAPDNVPPTISNVKLYVDTLNPGDSLKCEFEIIDVGSGLHHLWFDLYDPITGMANYEVRFFNGNDIISLGNNKYLLKKVIPKDAIKGYWYFAMEIYDNADNSKYYRKSAYQFFVNGVTSETDKFPPVITSVTMFPDTLSLSDTLKIILNATDNQTGLASGVLYLTDEEDNRDVYQFNITSWNNWKVKKISSTEYLISMAIPVWYREGNRKIRLDLFDKANNYITYNNPFSIYVTDQIDSIILNIDKIDFKDLLHIYPNPFNDIVNIVFKDNSFNDALLKIYNINGNLIYEKMISSNTAIDLSNFSKGTYCFVTINDKYVTSNLVIKK